MPIEILELVVKANVNAAQRPAQTADQNGSAPAPQATKKQLEAAVEQVLEILKRQKER